MNGVLTIARLSLKEALRRKLLLALLVITALVIGVTVWGISRLTGLTVDSPSGRRPLPIAEIRALTSQLLILVMFMFTFVLALSAVFTAAPAVGGEVESGIALAILTRPISRAEVIIGKWLGLAALATFYVAAAAGIEFVLVAWVTGYSPPHPFQFIAYMAGISLTVVTFGLLLSTRVPSIAGGIIGLGLYGLAWMGGIAYSIGTALNVGAVQTAGSVSRLVFPTDGLWHGAIYALEPAAVVTAVLASGRTGQASNPFFASAPPSAAYLAWCVAWLAVVLTLAMWSFNRREI